MSSDNLWIVVSSKMETNWSVLIGPRRYLHKGFLMLCIHMLFTLIVKDKKTMRWPGSKAFLPCNCQRCQRIDKIHIKLQLGYLKSLWKVRFQSEDRPYKSFPSGREQDIFYETFNGTVWMSFHAIVNGHSLRGKILHAQKRAKNESNDARSKRAWWYGHVSFFWIA